MQKGEKSIYYLYEVKDALVAAHSEVYPQSQPLDRNPLLDSSIKGARDAGFAEEQIPVGRSNVLFPDQVGVVFDALTKHMQNGSGNPLQLDELVLWKAEEKVFGVPHDPEAFMRRQELLFESYPSIPQGSESA